MRHITLWLLSISSNMVYWCMSLLRLF